MKPEGSEDVVYVRLLSGYQGINDFTLGERGAIGEIFLYNILAALLIKD